MGCLRNVFALVGFAVVLAVCAVLGWTYRAEIDTAYHRLLPPPPPPAVAPAPQGSATGRPSPAALRTARQKEDAMAQANGPGVVVLSPDEVASLVQDGLVPQARQALDSITVTFGTDRFTLEARVKTATFGPALGSLAGMFNPYEPLKLSGPAQVARPGRIAWSPDELVIKSFPFPKATVPALVRQLTGAPDGAIPIFVPATVGDLKIRPDGVRFYRKPG
ncbi:MAG TPA: hypothetical protein VGI83_00145 [Gemmatimonadales bacterium]|jgi:hypothetical protein